MKERERRNPLKSKRKGINSEEGKVTKERKKTNGNIREDAEFK